MFTGIVQGIARIGKVNKLKDILQYEVVLGRELTAGLQRGASVSIDGICQTVIDFDDQKAVFEAIPETIQRTTIQSLETGQRVNVERAAKVGDEIGGHQLSGHVFGIAEIQEIKRLGSSAIFRISCPKEWMKFVFPKGFIALNGASLTVVDVNEEGNFTVHLIPETLQATTFGEKEVGAKINLEFDSQTQMIVTTVERISSRTKRE